MSKLKNKKILVTGATGFVGGHLARRLLKEGAAVSVLVRSSGDPEVIKEFTESGVKVNFGDVTDRESVFKAVEGQEIIYHIAALFRQAKFPEKTYYDVNVEGVRNVLDAAEIFSIERVIHCSTVGVHSHIPSPPADENEPYRPGDIYQLTKCEGEKVAREYFSSGRLKGVIVRPAMIWGEGDKRTLKIYKGVARRRLPIIGSGKTLTHWVYVHDLINGLILTGENPKAIGQTYIFAGKRPVSISELFTTIADEAGVQPLSIKLPALPIRIAGAIVEALCKPFGIEPPLYRRRVDFFTKDRSFSTKKAEKELGYRPMGDFVDEVRNIFWWYKNQGWICSFLIPII